ncbi:cytochrome c-binding protein [Bacteroidia bacterium]|nr:cytochrome c-binding protein [Bacteroidia bacterium]
MMKRLCYILPLLAFCFSCTYTLPEAKDAGALPDIFPDYTGVTIPATIAPLNFTLTTPCKEAYAELKTGSEKLTIKAQKGQFKIPASAWKKLLISAKGSSIEVSVCAKTEEWVSYTSFSIYVATEPIDPYIAYRLIEPGYELWNRMGIYQRNLETFSESAIMENKLTDKNCMNCHSFCMQNPDKMLFHMRAANAGTLLIDGDKIEKLNTKTAETMSALVYPSWHPSGRYVAFSVNQTHQSFHQNDRNRVEVFDDASDVVVYDTEKHEIITTSLIFSPDAFETFPTFSPDGQTLYFCSAEAKPMPESFRDVRYSLCSISFDPSARRFGVEVDTLYSASHGKSASFPRVSPDGRHLLYTLAGYGNFSIWHKDADLYMLDLETGVSQSLDILNSDDVESYHSWSSNSRWIVFSSRRIDGLYTRPFIAHIDETGKASKPFLLPQKDTDFYHSFMKSYNIPEFITGKVKDRRRELSLKAKNDKGIDVRFSLFE